MKIYIEMKNNCYVFMIYNDNYYKEIYNFILTEEEFIDFYVQIEKIQDLRINKMIEKSKI